ncbi:hypothetical protein WIX39_023880 [Variovorax sp. AB1(2024)]|uniref:hypothetical protein n=1 Tax=Variovorax sp. AB1(2024) TaxID=3132214 RepID=UPI0030A25CAC
MPLKYDEAHGIDEKNLRGVRLLFLDLHLTIGAQSNNVAQTSAVIVSMLENGIDPTAGPYVIILWTKHQEQKDAFAAQIMDRLEATKRPLAILSLNKNDYLGGAPGEKLTADVTSVIETDPRLRALLDWEMQVLKAAGTALSEIGSLVAAQDRTAARFSEGLDEVLSLLAFEAVGKENAIADPYNAVNAALIPILSDRIANQRAGQNSDLIWKKAVTKVEQVQAPPLKDAARLNSMLHVATRSTEDLKTGTWGALSLLSDAELENAPMTQRFNLPAKPMLAETFKILERSDRRLSRLCVLRIGASCDYAQSRKGPVPFMLGAVVPAEAKRPEGGLLKAEIITPSFILDDFEYPVRLIFNAHLTFTMVPTEFENWTPLCRLREQLLMQITTLGAQHLTRPAIISFRPDESQ